MRLWDGQAEVAHLGGEQPLAVTVAVGRPLIRAAFMELSAGKGRNLGFQQALEATPHDLRNQGASGGSLHELVQLGSATMGEGPVSVRCQSG